MSTDLEVIGRYRFVRTAAACGLITFGLLTAVLLAQGRWQPPYDEGLKAFNRQDWTTAIDRLTRAVAQDPKPDKNKPSDGPDGAPYFPYVYLAYAHLKAGHLPEAEANFQKSNAQEKDLPKKEADLRTNGQAELSRLNQLANAPKPVPTPVTTPAAPPPGIASSPAKPPDPTPFEDALKEMEKANTARNWQETLKQLDFLAQLDLAEYDKRKLGDRRVPVARSRALEIVTEAQGLLSSKDFKGADTKFQEAERISPGVPGAKEGRADVANLMAAAAAPPAAPPAASSPSPMATPPAPVADAPTRSRDFLIEGQKLAALGRYAEAEAKYSTAFMTDGNNTAASSAYTQSRTYAVAVTNGKSLVAERKFSEARVQFATAQALDKTRFAREPLAAVLKQIDDAIGAMKPSDLAKLTIESATSSYLQGDAMSAITRLQDIKTDQLDNRTRAEVQAGIGVAKASRAFTAHTADERATLRAEALAAFQLVLAADPAFQLSSKLVSPKIRDLFEEARSKK